MDVYIQTQASKSEPNSLEFGILLGDVGVESDVAQLVYVLPDGSRKRENEPANANNNNNNRAQQQPQHIRSLVWGRKLSSNQASMHTEL